MKFTRINIYSNRTVIIGMTTIASLFVIITFLGWFIPSFLRGLTTTHEEQLCHLDQKNRERNFRKVIRSIEVDSPDPGAISFTFQDNSKYNKPLGFFRSSIDSLMPGDTMYKPYGELYLSITNVNKSMYISIEHGCNLAIRKKDQETK